MSTNSSGTIKGPGATTDGLGFHLSQHSTFIVHAIKQYNNRTTVKIAMQCNAIPSNPVVKTEINNILLTTRKNSIWSFSQSDDQSSFRAITWEDRFKTNTLKCWVKSYHLKALKRIMYSVTNFNLKSKALTCRSQCTVDITMGTSSLLASKSRNEVDKLKASLN